MTVVRVDLLTNMEWTRHMIAVYNRKILIHTCILKEIQEPIAS